HHKALVSTCRGDFDNAISFVKTALQQQPGLAWAWYLKANAQACNGDKQGAQEALARAEAANDNLSFKEFAAVVNKTSATKAAAERRLAGLASLGLA
ncbi:MAG: tetratricopeptide repeat protein, partial [Hyphomicrobiales bacterium]|nr:tetratricopeptide repeat protein [Hyphomicrobiales bacterium]